MGLLKKGSAGQEVRALQLLLQELDFNVQITGVFDTTTFNAVRTFQAGHLDKNGTPLEIDGKVGEITMWALQNPRSQVKTADINFTIMPGLEKGGHPIGRLALQFAIEELKAGAGEIGGNNMGKFVKKYMQPSGLGEGESWCAGFVSWCFLQAAGGDKSRMPFRYSAGARDIFNQFKAKGMHFLGTENGFLPQPGDIVAWWRVSLPSGKGHIGIVHHYADGFIYTIEGNKAANVAGFTYVKTRLDKVLGYGRVR
ncbi:MAG TPA: CHAP domain-containing protein [Algoriphagus sp.]|nr:CHAP domain-containing protein [Algoriphagus sp.]